MDWHPLHPGMVLGNGLDVWQPSIVRTIEIDVHELMLVPRGKVNPVREQHSFLLHKAVMSINLFL